MKKYVLCLFLLSLSNIYSQVHSGLIEYKKIRLNTVFEENKKNKSANFDNFSKLENKINEVQKDLIFDLYYKNGESFFEVRKTMSIAKNRFFKISLGSDGRSKYYNSDSEILRYANTFGDSFLISKSKYKWNLKSDSRTIGKYKCYKALMIEEMQTSKGLKKVFIEAWYAPEINIPFGPIGYSGLPGLILELKKDNIKYYTSNINLAPKNKFKIKKLVKGKRVTQKEFYEIGIKAMKKLKKIRG